MQFRKHPWHDDVELRPSDTAEDGDAPADAGGEDDLEEDDEDE